MARFIQIVDCREIEIAIGFACLLLSYFVIDLFLFIRFKDLLHLKISLKPKANCFKNRDMNNFRKDDFYSVNLINDELLK